MPDFLAYQPVFLALLATIFTWLATALGAAVVFLKRDMSRATLDVMLGFAGGVMIAASFWSLLAPSIEMAERQGGEGWIPAAVGFVSGGVFLRLVDYLLPHLHLGLPTSAAEGIRTSWKRSTLLVLAVTLHNIPEGLAVGVAFGAMGTGVPEAGFAGALALAVGIAIQNFPEGIAVSVPLRREGLSPFKSFWYGQLSGFVEPVMGIIGAGLVLVFQPVLPYALAFAAGAMIFVVTEEVIPESQCHGNADMSTLGLMGGFTIMMVLDVAFS